MSKQSYPYRGYLSTYNAKILNSFNPEIQLKDTQSAVENKIINVLPEFRGFKFETTLVLVFKKNKNDNETKYTIFYSNLKVQTVFNESDIDDIFESFYTTITSNIQKYLGKDPRRNIDGVIEHIINISKCNPLAGSSYIKLPKELSC